MPIAQDNDWSSLLIYIWQLVQNVVLSGELVDVFQIETTVVAFHADEFWRSKHSKALSSCWWQMVNNNFIKDRQPTTCCLLTPQEPGAVVPQIYYVNRLVDVHMMAVQLQFPHAILDPKNLKVGNNPLQYCHYIWVSRSQKDMYSLSKQATETYIILVITFQIQLLFGCIPQGSIYIPRNKSTVKLKVTVH